MRAVRRYAAVDPDVAVEALLASRAQQLRQATMYAERLADSFEGPQSGDIADTITSDQAVRQRLSQLLSGTHGQMRCLAGPPYLGSGGNRGAEQGAPKP